MTVTSRAAVLVTGMSGAGKSAALVELARRGHRVVDTTSLLSRLATRTTNPYGKTAEQRATVLREVAEIEPLLRAGATVEIDTRHPVTQVADTLEALARRQ